VSDPRHVDVAVVGGGIVGLATAMALSESAELSLLVLEKEAGLARHQTGHNSGVIHSGLYYRPGSLKAQTCVEGRKALVDFCRDRQIPFDLCGKLVVATRPEELPLLETLRERGRQNGLEGIRLLTAEEIADFEPHATGLAALHVPQTGIVDYVQVTEAFADQVRSRGGEVRTEAAVRRIRRAGDRLQLETPRGDFTCRMLVNCTGLHSDRLARMAGVDPGVQIIPFRGEYYELDSSRCSLVQNLIYPVPDPEFPFLGVHFTRMIGGGVEAGPNAVLAFKREGYHRSSFSLRDFSEIMASAGFWRLARRYWRAGLSEFRRSFSKRLFLQDLRRLLPELQFADIVAGGSGVRAQAVDAGGNLVDDFRIVETESMVHVLNAPSPAATASIRIGQTVAERVLARLANA